MWFSMVYTKVCVITVAKMCGHKAQQECDQDHDTFEQASIVILYSFSQSDWLIVENEHFWLVITTRNSYHKNSEWTEPTQ